MRVTPCGQRALLSVDFGAISKLALSLPDFSNSSQLRGSKVAPASQRGPEGAALLELEGFITKSNLWPHAFALNGADSSADSEGASSRTSPSRQRQPIRKDSLTIR
jgi:hypothetical protein